MRDTTLYATCLAAVASMVPAGPGPLAAEPAPASLPATIAPESMGRPAFEEKFNTLDAGADQTRPPHPHRWRTVYGTGGPASVVNRSVGGLTLGVDSGFQGTDNGAPLGIDPFSTGPQGLTITARKVAPALQARMFGKAWASGQLTTKFSFEQKYGYFEAEMDLPVCEKGAWAQFWLVPAKGPWPLHGEIDVPETVGNGKVFWTAHTGEAGHHDQAVVQTQGDCTRGWHRYGVLWRPDGIGYYYDGHLVGRGRTPGDFTEPMYMILGLTVGGSWPGPPAPAATQFAMRVRHVAAWALPR